MRLTVVIAAFLLFASTVTTGQMPHVQYGSIRRFDSFPSKYVVARNIDVWLPPNYNPDQKYSVLYMHDGKSLFDSTIMWNRQEWGVDEMMQKLLPANRIKNCIVVGIWNGEALRHSEYFPQKPFESLDKKVQDSLYTLYRKERSLFGANIQSDQYLRFIVRELKPFIDSVFSTRTDAKNTFVAGSSMGGLISMYAICEYPEVFGGAACLSTHWPGVFTNENNPIPAAFFYYLENHLPSPSNHKIYFDYGTATLDSLYAPHQEKVDEIMRRKGYKPKRWITKAFPGADHSENAWRDRLDIPILFLLGR